MGRVIQFESHRVELAFVLEFEHDTSVLEYYDQPCRLLLRYAGRSGRRVTARHTPDYFVLRTDTAGWEECKTEQDLLNLAAKSPHRYGREGNGAWRCLPGEDYAASLGLYYRIRNYGKSAGRFNETSNIWPITCEPIMDRAAAPHTERHCSPLRDEIRESR